MNLMTVLEVAIGLIFVWFLLSMLVSTVQEAISNIFQWRGKGLEKAIRGLLEEPSVQKKLQIPLDGSPAGAALDSLGDKFYGHPLVRSLSLDIDKHRPSYIPTGQFAEVLFDLIVKAGTSESPLKKAADRAESDIQGLDENVSQAAMADFHELLRVIEATAEAKSVNEAVLKSIDDQAQALILKYPALEPAVIDLKGVLTAPPLVPQLQAGIEALAVNNPQLKQTLDILVTRAVENARDFDQALAKARQNVETWFDNSMQRLSGTYKRRVQLVAFIVGIVVALLLDIDSLSIAKTLWFDQSVRALIVSQATSAAQATPQASATPQPAPQATSAPEPGSLAASEQSAGQIVDQLNTLQIPIGWTIINQDQALCKRYLGFAVRWCIYPGGLTAASNQLFRPSALLSLLGILITGIAAAQGAPFWFDLLSRLVSMRTSTAPSKAPASK